MTGILALKFAVFVAAAAITGILIVLLQPLLRRHALARPNARSSHRNPTPQGGGIAIIAAVTLTLATTAALVPTAFISPWRLAIVLTSAILLAIIGASDDIHPLPPLPRLLPQAAAVLAVMAALPADFRVLASFPWLIVQTLIFFAMLWLVNLVNFMDGIDWMTVVEMVPVTGALALFGSAGALPPDAMLAATALCGAIIGFAPFNWPVARLFLGDVGSLPIGLLLGWLLILLAKHHPVAALLLPLYYFADATITLLRRVVNGEPIMKAHHSHFYQRALDGGYTVRQIIARVFVLNFALVALAGLTLVTPAFASQAASLLAGCILVGLLLWDFNRMSRPA